jgi:hypothetical protein
VKGGSGRFPEGIDAGEKRVLDTSLAIASKRSDKPLMGTLRKKKRDNDASNEEAEGKTTYIDGPGTAGIKTLFLSQVEWIDAKIFLGILLNWEVNWAVSPEPSALGATTALEGA